LDKILPGPDAASDFDDAACVAAYRAFSSFLLGHLLLEVSAQGADISPIEQDDPDQDTADTDLSKYPLLQAFEPELSQDHSAEDFEEALETLLDRLDNFRSGWKPGRDGSGLGGRCFGHRRCSPVHRCCRSDGAGHPRGAIMATGNHPQDPINNEERNRSDTERNADHDHDRTNVDHTDHPTGEKQAQENADRESPA